MTKVSVILPVYNGADYLEESIKSIMGQSFSDFELIIVDDCSTDETPVIAQSYTNRANVIYHRNAHNMKLPASLNVGFSFATGEYLTWTSCDNVYLPDAFARMVATLDSDAKIGLVYADMQMINADDEELNYVPAGPAEDLIMRNVVGACFMYRAELAYMVGDYNVDLFLCEDYEFWMRCSLLTKLVPINEKLYLFRTHAKSLSQSHRQEVIAKGIKVQKHYYKYFVDNRVKAARFYAFLRARDIYNPFRHLYFLWVLFYSPLVFIKEIRSIFVTRWRNYAKD